MKTNIKQPKQKLTTTLTPPLRQELKNPLGTLLKGPPKQTMKELKQLIQKEAPTKIIAIGDVVTENMTKNHIPIQVMIVDNKVLRKTIRPIKTEAQKTLNVKNPPGTLTPQAWTTVQQALKQDHTTRVHVDGEEDLFTLVAVSQAPENSLVVYGQPNAGVVAVKVTTQTKKKVQLIIDAMQPTVEKPK